MRKKKLLQQLLLLLLLCIIAVSMYYVLGNLLKGHGSDKKSAIRDSELLISPGMTGAELQDRLNQAVESGMKYVSINPAPVFEDCSAEGDLRIQNLKANRYSYIVAITLDSGGEEVYRSGLLLPGHYIEKASLSKRLHKGTYSATARFTAYQNNSRELIGTAAAKIQIEVKK